MAAVTCDKCGDTLRLLFTHYSCDRCAVGDPPTFHRSFAVYTARFLGEGRHTIYLIKDHDSASAFARELEADYPWDTICVRAVYTHTEPVWADAVRYADRLVFSEEPYVVLDSKPPPGSEDEPYTAWLVAG